jgi:hypothetical protein
MPTKLSRWRGAYALKLFLVLALVALEDRLFWGLLHLAPSADPPIRRVFPSVTVLSRLRHAAATSVLHNPVADRGA